MDGVLSSDQRARFWTGLGALARPAADLSAQLTRSWLLAAQAEHASIASFSKFSLELLAVGAPAVLIEQAHRAALDEVEHARICFALASHFAGHPLGPGPLPVRLELQAPTLLEVACATVRDGCVGETLAACEAEAAADRATVPSIRTALEVIAIDERSHAELAWRFVGWALGQGGAELEPALASAFESAHAEACRVSPSSVFDTLLPDYGRLAGADRDRVRQRALREDILPAMRELLAT